jgi:chaperonin GroES
VGYRAAVTPTPKTPSKAAKDTAAKAARAPKAPGASGAGEPAAKRGKEPKQPITMLSDRVLAHLPQAEGERRSRAGILIPATAQVSRRLSWAEVVAVGPHVRTVKVGDKILFNPEDRFEVEVHGDEYVILRERDIHAVASEHNDGGTGLYL